MSLGNDVETGEDIEKAIRNKIRGTSVAHIEPKRNVGKIVDTIVGVSNWYSWKWPIDEEYSVEVGTGFIFKIRIYLIVKIRTGFKPDLFISGSTGPTELFIFGSTEFIYIWFNRFNQIYLYSVQPVQPI